MLTNQRAINCQKIALPLSAPIPQKTPNFSETGHPWRGNTASPFLGLHDGRAYALLYNGILGDRGNVLTRATLAVIREEIARKDTNFSGPLTVYGEQSRLTPATLDQQGIVFKQTPYDIKART